MKGLVLFAIAAYILGSSLSGARTFTDIEGRTLEGEMESADAENVVIRRKDGRTFEIRIETLSTDDRDYIAKRRKEREQKAAAINQAEEEAARASKAQEEIVNYCKSKIGEQVGDGECWTLADAAFNKAKAKRPGGDLRVWGREIDYNKEPALPGDIVEINEAKMSNGLTFPGEHTSVIVDTRGRYRITVCEQNVGGDKTVQKRDYDLRGLQSGTLKIYRYEGKKS